MKHIDLNAIEYQFVFKNTHNLLLSKNVNLTIDIRMALGKNDTNPTLICTASIKANFI